MSDPQICEKFLIGGCPQRDREKCPQAHVDSPYLWQIFTDGSKDWVNVKNNEFVEEQYCDPIKEGVCTIVDVRMHDIVEMYDRYYSCN